MNLYGKIDIGAAMMNDEEVEATTAATGWHTGPSSIVNDLRTC